MKILLIGAGKMAQGAVFDLLKNPDLQKLYVVDRSKQALAALEKKFKDSRIVCRSLAADDFERLSPLFAECAAALSAVPYDFNLALSKLAVENKTHFVDLGGNNDVVRQQFALHGKAQNAGVAIVPDCGLAPGMVSIIGASAIEELKEVEALEIRVGGLPVHPKPPLNYSLVFSVHGLINEYKEDALILEDGAEKFVPSLTDIETLKFPPPFGEMEAFYTSGGTSTLTQTYRGKIKRLNYKTIRYPGHCRLMKSFADLGFMDDEKINETDNENKRDLFEKLLSASLPHNAEDVVLIHVTSRGKTGSGNDKTIRYQAVEYGDKQAGLSAMARTTAFSAAIILQMLIDGRIADRGTLYQEISVPADEYIKELEKRNIRFEITIQD
jgi:lysine 6-dehydrogenase